jgi:hypothetical protein
MSEPAVEGPISEFERRCRLLFASSETARALIGAADADAAMTGAKILSYWDAEEQSATPTCPVIFVTPEWENVLFTPEANVSGIVFVSVHATSPGEHSDSRENGRRWFANQVGLILKEITELEGKPVGDSTQLRICRQDTDTDGFMMRIGPSWADSTDQVLPKSGGDGTSPTLIAAFYLHLET